jgi:hypothetical protein
MPRERPLRASQSREKSVSAVHDRTISLARMKAPVAPIEVDDPFAIAHDGRQRIVVSRSLRDDPVAALHAARQIDEAQYQAARYWQRAYEIVGGAGARAIDPTREPVDGGRIAGPFSDVRLTAVETLARATKVLGREGDGLVHDVLGRGMTIAAAADKRGASSTRAQLYVGRRFRECLETLAKEFGYAD